MILAEWKRMSSFEEHLRMDRGLIVKYSWSKSMVMVRGQAQLLPWNRVSVQKTRRSEENIIATPDCITSIYSHNSGNLSRSICPQPFLASRTSPPIETGWTSQGIWQFLHTEIYLDIARSHPFELSPWPYAHCDSSPTTHHLLCQQWMVWNSSTQYFTDAPQHFSTRL